MKNTPSCPNKLSIDCSSSLSGGVTTWVVGNVEIELISYDAPDFYRASNYIHFDSQLHGYGQGLYVRDKSSAIFICAGSTRKLSDMDQTENNVTWYIHRLAGVLSGKEGEYIHVGSVNDVDLHQIPVAIKKGLL